MIQVLSCIRAVWLLSWHTDRRRFLISSLLLVAAALCPPAVAYGAGALVDTFRSGTAGHLAFLSVFLVVALVGQLMLGHFAHLWYFELGESDEAGLNQRLLAAIDTVPWLDRIETPATANTIELLRQDIVRMRSTIQATLLLCCSAIQIGLSSILLIEVEPVLVLLPLSAVIPVWTGRRAERALQESRERGAPALSRLIHLRELAGNPASQKEILLSHSAPFLLKLHDAAEMDLTTEIRAGARRYAWLRTVGQLAFGLAFAATVAIAFLAVRAGGPTIGDLVLVVTLATQVSTQVADGLAQLSIVHTAAAGFDRLRRVESQSVPSDSTIARPAPATVVTGIVADRLGYTYPAAAAPALREVSFHVPAGSSLAVVGENGAGKSTLIRLLQGLYRADTGSLTVNGTPVTEFGRTGWHGRMASLSQDFEHFEFTARESIGLGDVERIDSRPAIDAAVDRADARDLLDRIGGLEQPLGHGYDEGVELSGGQWQSIGLARAFMRTDPLLLSLDEPAHALDPEAEDRMCAAYQRTGAELATAIGTVMVFVTHRLSTVRTADLILVLRKGRVEAFGPHETLLRTCGYYADLFGLQAAAYAPTPSATASPAGESADSGEG